MTNLLHLTLVADLSELLGRTLVLVAHADDEAVACGALLQRMRDPVVVICTDGAPRDAYFWHAYGSREAYARARAHEARRAAEAVGIRHLELLHESVSPGALVDQELFRRIPLAMGHLVEIADRVRPQAVLTLAYEGGHPDHDTCNFIGRQLANRLDIPVWEAPLYHRAVPGQIAVQQFIAENGTELRVDITADELARKRTMHASYASQRHVLEGFDARVEVVRPMADHDYSRPPHEGPLNYEAWGWPIRGWELCDQFVQHLNAASEPRAARHETA